MWLLINNRHEKNFEMVKQKKCTRITQSGKNYANNCPIRGVHLIWKQKIWLVICEFLWPLTYQNAWFVTSFCTELTNFCDWEPEHNNTGTLNHEFLLIQKSSSICKHYWISFTSMTVELKYLSCEYTPLEFSLSSCLRETTLTRVKQKRKREREKRTHL